MDEQARRLDAGRDVSELMAASLERGERLAERLALGRVGHGGVERRLGHADAAGTDARAEEVEGAHRDPEAMINLAEDVVRGHRDAVEAKPADRVIGDEGDRRTGEARAVPR